MGLLVSFQQVQAGAGEYQQALNIVDNQEVLVAVDYHLSHNIADCDCQEICAADYQALLKVSAYQQMSPAGASSECCGILGPVGFFEPSADHASTGC